MVVLVMGENLQPLATILCGLAAVVWIINAVLTIQIGSSLGLSLLQSVCAGIWVIAFLINLYRWRKNSGSAHLK